MNQQVWHIPDVGLSRYVDGNAGATERHSIETHLLDCDPCRIALADQRGRRSDSDRVWAGIVDRVDRPRRPLRWSTGSVQVSIASPALVAATLGLAVVLLTVVGVLGALGSGAALPLLVALAPLAPAVGAAIVFRPGIDPAGALADATPLAGGRLPFLRAGFSSLVAASAGLVATLFTPLGWSSVLVWLTPSLALAVLVAAVATWTDPARLACGAAALWGLVVAVWVRGHRGAWTPAALEELSTSRPVVQVACTVSVVAAALVCAWRRDAQPSWRTA